MIINREIILICHEEKENVFTVLKDCYRTNSSLDKKKQKQRELHELIIIILCIDRKLYTF